MFQGENILKGNYFHRQCQDNQQESENFSREGERVNHDLCRARVVHPSLVSRYIFEIIV